MTTLTRSHAVGGTLARIEGPEKVTGQARYAVEYPMENPVYIWLVQSSIARGRIQSIALDEAAAVASVVTILTHDNAPRLKETDDAELAVLQSDRVAYHGQIVA